MLKYLKRKDTTCQSSMEDGTEPQSKKTRAEGPLPSSSSNSTQKPSNSNSDNTSAGSGPTPNRAFKESWRVGRPWIQLDNGKIYCTWCTKHKDQIMKANMSQVISHAFIKGSTNLKLSSIKDHEVTSSHRKAAEIEDNSSKKKENTPAGKALLSLQENQRTKLRLLFRNAHAVARHNRPMTDYDWLNQLDHAKGLGNTTGTYENHQACGMFIDYIGADLQNALIKKVSASSYFSITMDGCTDIGAVEQESIYIRSVSKGQISCDFMKITEPNSTTAEDLHRVLHQALEEVGPEVAKKKFIGTGCDGAFNMMGKNKGAVTLLKQDYPYIITIHCLCHRLELAYKDVFKKATKKALYARLITLLIGLYYFYKRSSAQKRKLKNTFKALERSPQMPQRMGGTRWLGHTMRAVDSTTSTYDILVTHLSTESHSNAKAEGLCKMLLSAELLVFMLFLRHVMDPLRILSEAMQRKTITLAEAHQHYEAALSTLNNLNADNLRSPELQDLLSQKGKLVYKGTELKGAKPKMAYSKGIIQGLKACLENRFEDLGTPVISATKIANLKLWPANANHDPDFGTEELETLCEHFNEVLPAPKEDIVVQWRNFKALVIATFKDKLYLKTWEEINRATHDMGVNGILAMIDLILALPPTSVENERCFSQLKLIKTDKRQRISQERLNNVMLIRLNGPSVTNFDPNSAIDAWLAGTGGSTTRRLAYSRSGKLKCLAEKKSGIQVPQADDDEPEIQEAEEDVEMEEGEVVKDSDYSNDDQDYCSYDEEDYEENCKKLEKYSSM